MTRQTTTHGRRLRVPAITRKQLRRDSRYLKTQLNGAEACIAGQALAIAERDAHIEALEQRIAQLQADRVDLGVLEKQLDAAQGRNARLAEANIALTARLQNLESLTVPVIGDRDTTEPDDQNTEPIYVGAWRAYLAKQARDRSTPQVKPLAEAFGGAK